MSTMLFIIELKLEMRLKFGPCLLPSVYFITVWNETAKRSSIIFLLLKTWLPSFTLPLLLLIKSQFTFWLACQCSVYGVQRYYFAKSKSNRNLIAWPWWWLRVREEKIVANFFNAFDTLFAVSTQELQHNMSKIMFPFPCMTLIYSLPLHSQR